MYLRQTPIRIGIVGCGGVSHFQHNLWLDRRAEWVVLYDRNEQLCRQRVGGRGVPIYSTKYRTAGENSQVDAIIIANPKFSAPRYCSHHDRGWQARFLRKTARTYGQGGGEDVSDREKSTSRSHDVIYVSLRSEDRVFKILDTI